MTEERYNVMSSEDGDGWDCAARELLNGAPDDEVREEEFPPTADSKRAQELYTTHKVVIGPSRAEH